MVHEASFLEAVAAVLGAIAAKAGVEELTPVWPPPAATGGIAGGGGAGVGAAAAAGANVNDHAYQNTTYEAMSAFLSDLPVLDRSGAEKVLREDGVDGTFVLRRKAGTDSAGVVSCLSRGKIEHHILNLKENREKNGAVWVSKQTALDEISMVEAASGLLLDKHVRHPKWLQSKATFT